MARLHQLLRTEVSAGQVEELLDQIGCDVEGVATELRYQSKHSDHVIEATPQESLPLTDTHSGFTGEKPEDVWRLIGEEKVVRLDLLPVRPDLFDAGGLARALRGYLGVEAGLCDYPAADAAWRVEVDERIVDPKFGRPLIQCAVIRGLAMDEDLLRAILRLQENLHWALCRDRKFASIGAYDLDTLESPIHYTLVDADEFRFTPLFWGQRDPVSPRTMLAEHPKGVGYAHLVEGMSLLPALIAANGAVLSLPPVINAEETKLTTATKSIFLDVTGSNERTVTKALAILATSLIELDPTGKAHLERVEMVYRDRTVSTPELKTERFSVDPERAARLIGVPLTRSDCVELLSKMRHGVDDPGEQVPASPLQVTVAAYRNDIMHEVDLIEDIAIAYGYHRIEPGLVPTFTAGKSMPLNDRARRAAAALTGLGFTETLSLVLTSERDHYEKLRRKAPPRRVELANPASVDQTMLREHLYSSLLELLSLNTDHPLPQKIFEVGDVVAITDETDENVEGDLRPREVRVIAGAICDTKKAGYASGRSALDALLLEMGVAAADGSGVEYRPDDNPTALPGRAACVYAVGRNSTPTAEVFEVHPEVLENWRLSNPVVMFSLRLGEVGYE